MEQQVTRIAIVGAGAMGVLTAYHLSAANIEVDFLVRPSRVAKMPTQYRLYSYDDATTPVLGGFGVLARPSELARQDYEFVILCLDGAGLRSEDGRSLLVGIGAAIRDKATVLIVGSMGLGLRDLAIQLTGLPDDRVVTGRLGLLGHKVAGAALPLHAPTDREALMTSDYAFRHVSEGGFAIEDRNAAARRFAKVFDRCGIAKCFVVPPELFALQSRQIFPVFALSELLGWPPAEGFVSAGKLWALTIEAVRQIQGLAEHGEAGQKAAAEMSGDRLLAMWKAMEAASLPLDWQAFNAYHHGDKVKDADKLLLAGCIEQGESEGRDMSAVKEILSLWR